MAEGSSSAAPVTMPSPTLRITVPEDRGSVAVTSDAIALLLRRCGCTPRATSAPASTTANDRLRHAPRRRELVPGEEPEVDRVAHRAAAVERRAVTDLRVQGDDVAGLELHADALALLAAVRAGPDDE